MTDDRAINFRKQYGGDYKSIELRVLGLIIEDAWSFNTYREVDEIADEDSDVPYFDPDYDWEDYTDADAQLDNDYRDYIDDEV